MFLEGMTKIEGVHDNGPPSKHVEYVVVDEIIMNVNELLKDVNHISLKEKQAKDMEGD